MDSAFFLVLRRMRSPIIVLIVIYAIAVVGLTLVPGVDGAGQPTAPMSFFHAFYFVSYTATTIGFGEIPVAFSDAQRLWVTLCIYLTVIGWSYSIVTLIALLQDKGFQNTLKTNRFAGRVRRIQEPFYLVCGCGETGRLLCETFDRIGHAFVVVEKDEQRVEELDLLDFKTDTPALAGDARLPQILVLAGLRHRQCRGVLATTDDEQSNLAVAIAVRLLHPAVPVIARARSEAVAANMASFGTDHIINPFERFAEHLALAVSAPERFRLIELITGLPETPVPEPHRPPRGHWIMCGYGRFGHAVERHLEPTGITLTIIDPTAPDADHSIPGDGTEARTLRAAGIETAAGIVAGTDNDVNNLSIAVTAHELRPDLFVVLRQNRHANSLLFDAFAADFAMVPSHIVAQECIALLTTPLLAEFLARLHGADEAWCARLVARLQDLSNGLTPAISSLHLTARDTPAAHRALILGRTIRIGDLLREGTDRGQPLAAVVLLVDRDGDIRLLPDEAFELDAGDRLLIASGLAARRSLEFTVDNANELEYVLSGRTDSGSWLWAKLAAMLRL